MVRHAVVAIAALALAGAVHAQEGVNPKNPHPELGTVPTPLGETSLDDLIGMPVFDRSARRIASVEDATLGADGRLVNVILAVEGPAVGQVRQVAVDVGVLKLTEDESGNLAATTPLTRRELDALPDRPDAGPAGG